MAFLLGTECTQNYRISLLRHGITVLLHMLSVAKFVMLVTKRTHSHMHTFSQSDKLVTIFCLQAANQHRSATMPSCKGARVRLSCCTCV